MYTINETTGEEYYFNPFEKWWHYFLLCFTWFVPHRIYKLIKDSDNQIEILNNQKKKYSSSIIESAMIFSIIGLIRVFRRRFFFETSASLTEFLFEYILISYFVMVIITIVLWKFFPNKKIAINKSEYLDIKIRFLGLKPRKTMILKIAAILFCLASPLWGNKIESTVIFIMISGGAISSILMIEFGIKTSYDLEDGSTIKFVQTL